MTQSHWMHITPRQQGQTQAQKEKHTLITPYKKTPFTAVINSRTIAKNSQAGATNQADSPSLIQSPMIPTLKHQSITAPFAGRKSNTSRQSPRLSRFHIVWSTLAFQSFPHIPVHNGHTF